MIDVQGPLITAGLVAIIGAMVQIYNIVQDRKRAQSKDAREAAKEPLVTRAMDLDNLDQYTMIQQRMIDGQGEEIKKLTLRVATLTAENKTLREQIVDIFIEMRKMERRQSLYEPFPPHSEDDDPT